MKVKTGLQVNLPSSANPGEPLFTTDQDRLYVGTGTSLVEFPNLSYVTSAIAAAIVVVKAYVDAAIAGLGTLYQLVSGKDAANGYAGLDGSGLIHPSELPTPTTSTFGGVKDLAAVVHRFVTSIVNGVPISAQPAASDLSNGTTGSGAVVLAASPVLSGTPTAPTATAGTNTTQLATTAFVQSAVVSGTDVDSLATLSDVALSSPSNGQILDYNGSAWVNHTLVAGDIPNIAESQVTSLVSDLAAKVPTTRLISTTVPLTGGGDLSADRTLAISNFTGDAGSGGAKGAVPAPAAGDAAAKKVLKADGTWGALAESDITSLTTDLAAKVPTSRLISTTAPLTGGGDLSANRTLAISDFVGDSGSGGVKGTVPAPSSGDGAAGKFLKADGTWADPGSSNSVVAVASAVIGKPAAGQFVAIYTAYTSELFPANFASPNSFGTVGVNPASTALYSIYKNGVLAGTISISTSGVFTFATTGGVSFTLNAGDRLTIVAPGSQDANLQDVGMTLVGTRTGSIAAGATPIFTWKGTYAGGTAYQPFDVVAYDPGTGIQTYVCILTTTGHAPTNATYWNLMAQAGAAGGASIAGVQQDTYVYAADTGSVNAYVITLSPAPTLVAGSSVVMKAANANTASSTVVINGGSPITIKKESVGSLVNLTGGEINAGQIIPMIYDGTNLQIVGGGGGGNTTAQYVIGKPDTGLTNSKVNSFAYNGPDVAAASPNAMDDEFDDTTGNSGTGNGLNARWSWVNQGSATLAYQNSCLIMDPAANSQNERMIVQAAPATPWEITAKLNVVGAETNQWGGIVLYDSISGRLMPWMWYVLNGNGPTVFRMNSVTSFNNTQAQWNFRIGEFNQNYFRVKDDGTNIIFSFSPDGILFYQLYSEGRTAFLTNGANKVGVSTNGWTGTGQRVKVACDWFRRTA